MRRIPWLAMLLVCWMPLVRADEQPHSKRIPEIEKLLEQASRFQQPGQITALRLARLKSTPPLLAELVLREGLDRYLLPYRLGRDPDGQAWLYGIYLALHVEPSPFSREQLVRLTRYATPVGLMSIILLYTRWPDNRSHQIWWNRDVLGDPRGRQRATELLELRIPLDEDVLAELSLRAGKIERPGAGQLKRLGAMWHRLDDSGRAYLATHRGKLAPLLQRMVDLRGIPGRRRGR